jgi:hypothetical protein
MIFIFINYQAPALQPVELAGRQVLSPVSVATVAKECAVKDAVDDTSARSVVTPNGYTAVTVGTSTTACTGYGTSGNTITATSQTPASYASFTYATDTGDKTCLPANSTGCNAGAW